MRYCQLLAGGVPDGYSNYAFSSADYCSEDLSQGATSLRAIKSWQLPWAASKLSNLALIRWSLLTVIYPEEAPLANQDDC